MLKVEASGPQTHFGVNYDQVFAFEDHLVTVTFVFGLSKIFSKIAVVDRLVL